MDSMIGTENRKIENTLITQQLFFNLLSYLWTMLMQRDKVNDNRQLQKEGKAGNQKNTTFCNVPGLLFVLFTTISQNSALSLAQAIFFFQINKSGEPIHYQHFKGVPRALNRHCTLCGELMIEKEERSNFHHGLLK